MIPRTLRILPCLLCLTILVVGPGCRPESGYSLAYVTHADELVLARLGASPGEAGRRPDTVTLAEKAGGPLSWSPDGRFLAFASAAGDGGCMTVVSPDEGKIAEATLGRGRPVRDITWSGDGGLLLIDSSTSLAGTLFCCETDSWRRLPEADYFFGYCASPDGGNIALGRARDVAPPMPELENDDTVDLILLDPRTGESRLLLQGDDHEGFIPTAWPSPDRLVVRVYRRGAPDATTLAEIDPRAAAPRLRPLDEPTPGADGIPLQDVLTPALLSNHTGESAWSPDREWLAVTCRDDEGIHIWLAPAAGGTPRRLGPGRYPAWRPDPSKID